jgi:hypothetical protein
LAFRALAIEVHQWGLWVKVIFAGRGFSSASGGGKIRRGSKAGGFEFGNAFMVVARSRGKWRHK